MPKIIGEESIRGNILMSIDQKKIEYHPGAVSQVLQESQLFSIFDAIKATIDDRLLDKEGINVGVMISDASIKPYERGFNGTLDTMLESVGFTVEAIVDNDGNHLIEISR